MDHYADNMYQVDEFLLKPMNCPAHALIFKKKVNSYRDLPRRISEFGCCHRNEPSGSLHGLMRVRQFVQDDAHIFCEEHQIESEVRSFCQMLKRGYSRFGFDDVKVALSLRPRDRAGDDLLWDKSEKALEKCLIDSNIPYDIQEGEGAFYGPKLEFSLKDSQDRWWQCGTLQLDFVLPSRLGVSYMDRNGSKAHPVMIHRAILGSLERFIAILLEHYGKDLPDWLCPVEIALLPVNENFIEFCQEIKRSSSRRIEIYPDESISKRVRNGSKRGIPYVIVVGEKEQASGQMNVRKKGSEYILIDGIDGIDDL
jgi:threonyl-tRNA synthetase